MSTYIDLSKIEAIEGGELELEVTLGEHTARLGSEEIRFLPSVAKLHIVHEQRMYRVSISGTAGLRLVCGRCLDEYETAVEFEEEVPAAAVPPLLGVEEPSPLGVEEPSPLGEGDRLRRRTLPPLGVEEPSPLGEGDRLRWRRLPEDGFIVEGSQLELEQIENELVLSALPIVRLCKPDCKGLCPHCGQNLNHGECHCSHEPDEPSGTMADLLRGLKV